jgi:hypothetical protein
MEAESTVSANRIVSAKMVREYWLALGTFAEDVHVGRPYLPATLEQRRLSSTADELGERMEKSTA